jgi:hypothetical protein
MRLRETELAALRYFGSRSFYIREAGNYFAEARRDIVQQIARAERGGTPAAGTRNDGLPTLRSILRQSLL